MSKIQVLDCTLRDGGYCNNWTFGATNIRRIIDGLIEAQIEIIECGFLNHYIEYQNGVSKFNSMTQLFPFFPKDRGEKKLVVMANYGEIDIQKLEERSEDTVDGIRIAFHKKDLEEALKLCAQVKEKGYDVFIQAMVSLAYTDEEFLDLIRKANVIKPYAFYIVDSFGVMKQSDLTRLYYIVEHNLVKGVKIGYHSHNNLQLAYSNAQSLAGLKTNRELILDSSIMGMGRGAGNLNTELFVEYLNETNGANYALTPILKLIDEIISKFHQENYWGYSLPNYLSAKHNIHPNYARYLANKNTLTITEMDAIFEKIVADKRVNFDKKYIEELYLDYMKKETVNDERLQELKKSFENKKILLIAPGKSAETEKQKILEFMQQSNVISISVNFDYLGKTDYIFVSNIRRFKVLDDQLQSKVIITSNIAKDDCFLKVNYADLINGEERVADNAGLMLIKLFINLGIPEVFLAGYDGYSYENTQNYANESLKLLYRKDDFDSLNKGMNNILCEYLEKIKINFYTQSRFVGSLKDNL